MFRHQTCFSNLNKLMKANRWSRLWLGVIGMMVIISAFCVVSGSGINKPNIVSATQIGSSNAADKVVTANIGDVIVTDQFEIVIVSVEAVQKVGLKYIKSEASKDNTYIVINWQYKGIADIPDAAFPSPSITLIDGNSIEYSLDICASGSYAAEINLDREVFRDLVPEISVKDANVFEIPTALFKTGEIRMKINADTLIYVNMN